MKNTIIGVDLAHLSISVTTTHLKTIRYTQSGLAVGTTDFLF